jgi:hypothetical protein
MSGKGHNKKRNSLLIYEFLVKTISKALIENDKKKSASALKILRRHFKPGTELYREFRLMNALAKTTVSSEHIAASILKEAKTAAVSMNVETLDRQKSILIKTINHAINDENFYDQTVNEYRDYATIQTLVNEWRSSEKDIGLVAKYEDQLLKMLTTEKAALPEHTITEDTSGTSRLLMKVMTKKLNEKYGSVLNEQQKALVKAYTLSAASDDPKTITMKLHEIKEDVVSMVDTYISQETHNEFLKNKLVETKKMLLEEDLSVVDDDTVTRFMLYSRLKNELETEE